MSVGFAPADTGRGGARGEASRASSSLSGRRQARLGWPAVAVAALAALAVCGLLFLAPPLAQRLAVHAAVSRAHAPTEVAAFYDARGDWPIWSRASGLWPFTRAELTPAGRQLATLVVEGVPGEIPAAVQREAVTAIATARSGKPGAVARAEVALSVALTEYAHSASARQGAVRLDFVDPDFPSPADGRDVLERAAAAPSSAANVAAMIGMNPIYRALRQELVNYHRAWGTLPQSPVAPGDGAGLRRRLGLTAGATDAILAAKLKAFQDAHGLAVTGAPDAATVAALNAGAAHYERLIVANLQRARVLPPPTGGRYVLVNPAAQQLWLYQDGRVVDSMKIIIGKSSEQTPMMAGLIRYMVFNPSWEIPVDLVRTGIAPKVLAGGAAAFHAQHLQALSDWSDDAFEISPDEVDWKAVAAGTKEIRVRQLPGGDNMMGQVKFMLPNELGIYLHDTPSRGLFGEADRRLSAGCVRVERAHDLAAWLLGGRMADPTSLGVDDRVDLEKATPVYITYLTAQPKPGGGIAFWPDVYGRDPRLLAALGEGPAHGRRPAG